MYGRHISGGSSWRAASRQKHQNFMRGKGRRLMLLWSCQGDHREAKWEIPTWLGRARGAERAIRKPDSAGIDCNLSLLLWYNFSICQTGTIPSTFQGCCENKIMNKRVHRVPCQYSVVFTPNIFGI